ncbi:MAG: replicative DNA helicase [Dehalococcoidia bacterium]|nr:replicative DNA helicase [Dehalococcoidia bacterium]
MYAERTPPHNLEAEEGVIGSLLLDSEGIVKVAEYLHTNDFLNENTRRCYEACLALYQRGETVDQLTVADELARRNWLQDLGGQAYLSSLIAALPTSLHVEQYARMVARMALLRGLIQGASEIAALAYESPADPEQALNQAELVLFRLRSRYPTREFISLREVLDQFLADTSSASMPGPLQSGTAPIPTGLGDLDQLLGGLQRSDLTILAARPSVGKSALALNIARNAAAQGAVVGLFSLEMSRDQLATRLLSSETGIDTHRLRLGLYGQEEERRLVDAVGRLSDLKIYMDDSPMLTILSLRSRVRRLHLQYKTDLIVVDYLQLLQGTSNRTENRVQEISEISRSLKTLARELNVPVLACSQLSRAVEIRPSHRPQLSDLRDSGSIEQDADVVMFIHREDMYMNQEEWEQRNPDRPYPQNLAEIIIAKHRHGPTGSVFLRFNGRLARFEAAPALPVP